MFWTALGLMGKQLHCLVSVRLKENPKSMRRTEINNKERLMVFKNTLNLLIVRRMKMLFKKHICLPHTNVCTEYIHITLSFWCGHRGFRWSRSYTEIVSLRLWWSLTTCLQHMLTAHFLPKRGRRCSWVASTSCLELKILTLAWALCVILSSFHA